ncbi:hypothetical protein [Sorangium sp. So ce1000]|uniref:hypothetical protein n=1 Tax=Sorangium sp. So ce1000 TaxID=3133325 RepID=UPI003F62E02F
MPQRGTKAELVAALARSEQVRMRSVIGDIALVRQRQYLVEDVVTPEAPNEATRVDLVCLDDDAQGVRLSVLWEIELCAEVLQPEAEGLGAVASLDAPRRFAACFHALKWSSVTATRADLFQAPFRAGIKLLDHLLTPPPRVAWMTEATMAPQMRFSIASAPVKEDKDGWNNDGNGSHIQYLYNVQPAGEEFGKGSTYDGYDDSPFISSNRFAFLPLSSPCCAGEPNELLGMARASSYTMGHDARQLMSEKYAPWSTFSARS